MNFYPEEEARALVIKAGLELQKKQLVSRTWGNVSARISCSRFVITPSGRAYDDLRPEDLVVVNIEDCSYDGEIKPSSEKKIHAAAYALREDISFIIHTHQFYASAVGAEGEDLPFAPCAGYGLPGTGKLRKRVAEAISENPAANAFLMKRHGALCLGKSYEDAFRIAEETADGGSLRKIEVLDEVLGDAGFLADGELCHVGIGEGEALDVVHVGVEHHLVDV